MSDTVNDLICPVCGNPPTISSSGKTVVCPTCERTSYGETVRVSSHIERVEKDMAVLQRSLADMGEQVAFLTDSLERAWDMILKDDNEELESGSGG